jgi:hypothetical protein
MSFRLLFEEFRIGLRVYGRGLRSLATGPLFVLPAALGAQAELSVSVRLYVVLPDPSILERTIAGATVHLTDTSGASQTVVTGEDGVAIVRLQVGPQRISAKQRWRGRVYAWDLPVRVTHGLQSVTLDSSNALTITRLSSNEPLSQVIVSTREPPKVESPDPHPEDSVFWPNAAALSDRFLSASSLTALFDLGVFGVGSLPLLKHHWSSPCTDEACATVPAALRTVIGALLMARAVPVGVAESGLVP